MASKKGDPIVASVSGAMAGVVETLVVWPVENIKTRLQIAKTGTYKGMLDCTRRTVAEVGPLGLYQGMAPVIIGAMPKAAIRFGGFSTVQGKLRLEDGSITPLRNLVSGLIAGALEAAIVVVPVETTKTKLVDLNSSFLQGARHILANEGVSGFYKGALATIGKQSSNQGLRFMFFGAYSNFMSKGDPSRKLNPIENLVGGMMAGCFSTVCNNPFDLVKSRMQSLKGSEYNGFVDCAIRVVREEGVLALWSGTLPRLMRVVPGQGVIFMSFGTISGFIGPMIKPDLYNKDKNSTV